jgi:chemotaxis protein methyltransferase CheR
MPQVQTGPSSSEAPQRRTAAAAGTPMTTKRGATGTTNGTGELPGDGMSAWPLAGGAGCLAISRSEFQALSHLLYRAAGISLSDSKVQLVASRLAKRLRHLGMSSYREYHEYVRSGDPQGCELREMVNCLTTNKTSFFREAHHFDFLQQTLVPEMEDRARRGCERRIRVWSAACSTGEEPFSIAMTLHDCLGGKGWDIKILASDIDTNVLDRAMEARYPADAAAGAGGRRHFLPVGEPGGQVFEVRPEIRQIVAFRQLNLNAASWPIRGPFDAIFCRNVLIYFDRPTQRRVLERFARYLRPGGYLFVGHSETLYGVTARFESLGQTMHRLPVGSRAQREDAGVQNLTVPLGGVCTSRDPVVFRTVLGSCVAACLFDPVAGVAGMNHFLLPTGRHPSPHGEGGATCASGEGEAAAGSTRYGTEAMRRLVDELLRLGAAPQRLRAKAFGGAEATWLDGAPSSPPRQNVEFVKSFLAEEGIPLVAHRFGGHESLEVRFFAPSGRVLARPVASGRAGADRSK